MSHSIFRESYVYESRTFTRNLSNTFEPHAFQYLTHPSLSIARSTPYSPSSFNAFLVMSDHPHLPHQQPISRSLIRNNHLPHTRPLRFNLISMPALHNRPGEHPYLLALTTHLTALSRPGSLSFALIFKWSA